jgi:hypothetical protein
MRVAATSKPQRLRAGERSRKCCAKSSAGGGTRLARGVGIMNAPRYEIALQSSLPELIDRIAGAAAALGVSRKLAHTTAELMLRTRVTQTESCGLTNSCRSLVWAGEPRPCVLTADAGDLPRIFAATLADTMPVGQRALVEERLASLFDAHLAPLLLRNDRCGRGAACTGAMPTDPFVRRHP